MLVEDLEIFSVAEISDNDVSGRYDAGVTNKKWYQVGQSNFQALLSC